MPIPVKRIPDPTLQQPIKQTKPTVKEQPLPKPKPPEELYQKKQERPSKEPMMEPEPPRQKPTRDYQRFVPRMHEPKIVYAEPEDERYFKFDDRLKNAVDLFEPEDFAPPRPISPKPRPATVPKPTPVPNEYYPEPEPQIGPTESTIIDHDPQLRQAGFPFINAIGIFAGIALLAFGIWNSGGFYETSSRLSGDLAVFFYVWQVGNILQVVGILSIYHNGMKIRESWNGRRKRTEDD